MLPKAQRLNLKLETNREVFAGKKFFAKSKTFGAYFDLLGKTGHVQVAVNVGKKEIPLAVNRNQAKRKMWALSDQMFVGLYRDIPELRLIFQVKKQILKTEKSKIRFDFTELEKEIRAQKKSNHG